MQRLQAAYGALPSTDLSALAELDAYELVPALNPGMVEPRHLAAIIDTIERSRHEQVRAVIAAPPQHGKSVAVTSSLVGRMLSGKGRSAYVSYNQDRADEVSLQTQWMADGIGLAWEGQRRKWGPPKGASVIWTSIGGSLTGSPIDDLLVVDDPVKDRIEASSPTYRDRVWDWWTAVALTRCHPGASIIVVATRWHEDDLSGRLVDAGWPYICLQAIDDTTGEALWPEQRPLEFLQEQRRQIGEHDWAALYQGRPRPRGDAVFGDPTFYRALPRAGLRYAHGVDLAYSAKTTADYSVCVTMARHPEPRPLGTCYIIDVQRKQVDAPAFALTLHAMQSAHAGPMLFRCSGTEKGAASFIAQKVRRFRAEQVRGDKFVNATPYAAAWNDGRVMLPEGAPWLADFLTEHQRFTGVSDAHDDQVDAAGNAFAAVSSASAGYAEDTERRRAFPRRRI